MPNKSHWWTLLPGLSLVSTYPVLALAYRSLYTPSAFLHHHHLGLHDLLQLLDGVLCDFCLPGFQDRHNEKVMHHELFGPPVLSGHDCFK